MRRQHNILVGERTAEQIKIQVGSAVPELEHQPEDLSLIHISEPTRPY